MSQISSLGYLGFATTDLEAWRRWATDVLGLQAVDRFDGTVRFRVDERAWRIEVTESDRDALEYTGWEVRDLRALEAVSARLTEAGIAAEWDPETAQVRQVEALIRCQDPDGNQLEFYYGGFIPRDPFVSPQGVRFVTGALGLGHILHLVSDQAATEHFYLDVLGFRLSDTITFGRNRVTFTHVNARHHSLAFVQGPDGRSELGHFMLEVDSLDTVGQALDRVNEGGAVLTETLGKHTNDHMISFYMRNPSGSQTEYGWAGRLINEAEWTAASYDATAFWGHKVPGSEYSAGGPISPRDGS